MNKISVKLLRELTDYDSITGIMTWRKRSLKHFAAKQDWITWNKRFAGKECGTLKDGYKQMRIKGVYFYVHRAAFAHHHGRWPKFEIDHIDQNPLNNCIRNLRDTKENSKNKGKNSRNKSGYTGVSWHSGAKKWMAYVGKQYLGLFEDPELAGFVCELTRDKLGYHPNHGK